MRPTAILISSVMIGAGLLAGCGSSSETAAPPATDNGVNTAPTTAKAPPPDIVISNFAYTVRAPLKPGQQVTVVNTDEPSHSLAADTGNAFDVRVSGGGGVETFMAPMTPGTYEFRCKYHANMIGSLTVQ